MQKRLAILAALVLGACGSPEAVQHPTRGGVDAGAGDLADDEPPLNQPTTDDGPPDLASCGGMRFPIERRAPNVMLVIDRSASMNDKISGSASGTKWTDLKSAVGLLVDNDDSLVRLGEAIFPIDTHCGVATAPDVTIGASHGQAALDALTAKAPPASANTPTAAALGMVLASGQLADATRDNYVILATDGNPHCATAADKPADEAAAVTAKVTALANATPPVKTFVIGIGSDNITPANLDAWAVSGGTARSGATRYYDTQSASDLSAAFAAIGGGIASCTFHLTSHAPDPTLVSVTENGAALMQSPTNGYSYDAAGDTVTLNGAACDALKVDGNTDVAVVYGCPAPTPVP